MPGTVNIGIIGGGLMGREIASAAARWCHLQDFPVRPAIKAVASRTDKSCQWFVQNIPSIELAGTDYRELLAIHDIDAVYCAVPHNLHERFYIDIIEAGKHLLGEKPFGIDLKANNAILSAVQAHPELTVRCVSQFAFYPGAQRIVQALHEGAFGRILEVEAGFLHSSDLNPEKPINWKRVAEFNGEYGCMGDLGMHVLYIPLRAGWKPRSVRSVLSNIHNRRKNSEGKLVPCDTWDNATLLCEIESDGSTFPMTLKMQRIAPGEMNTWYLGILGERFSARFSLKQPRTLQHLSYKPGGGQIWSAEDLGYHSVYPAVTGEIFEFGFTDAIQQMLAAFLDRLVKETDEDIPFDCPTPEETRIHHQILTAALRSHEEESVVAL